MNWFGPAQLPSLPAAPPFPCTCCLVTILPGHPYTKVEITAPREEGVLCGTCWDVARGALKAHGAAVRERGRQITLPPADP